MIFANEPCILHLLAGSESLLALDAIKSLLDSGKHFVDERDPDDEYTPLHIAASWDNLIICQILVHYGADLNARDIDGRRPLDLAKGKSKRFLKNIRNKSENEKWRLIKFIGRIFDRIRHKRTFIDDSFCPIQNKNFEKARGSCPELTSNNSQIQQYIRRSSHTSPIEQINLPRSSELEKFYVPSIETTMQLPHDSLYLEAARERFVDEKKHDEHKLRQLFSNMRIDTLKRRLKLNNIDCGPINLKNRQIYETKLINVEIGTSSNYVSKKQYSNALLKMIFDLESGKCVTDMGIEEEKTIKREYATPIGKNDVSFFCYLLIDPSKISADEKQMSFNDFISSIFYVGKGKRSRSLQHLIIAHQNRANSNSSMHSSEKLKRILDLWDRNIGVISLHIFQNIHSGEAFIREGAMIEAIGVKNLTNIKRGQFSGAAKHWCVKQLTEFGALLLYRAFAIFQNERCRPILESDLIEISKSHQGDFLNYSPKFPGK